ERVIISLWTCFTHVYTQFAIASRIKLTSEDPGSGKSVLRKDAQTSRLPAEPGGPWYACGDRAASQWRTRHDPARRTQACSRGGERTAATALAYRTRTRSGNLVHGGRASEVRQRPCANAWC